MTNATEVKRIVELFPDYCSTGLWLVNLHEEDGSPFGYHSNIDADELGISEGLKIAIKYWHSYWESFIADITDERDPGAYERMAWYIDRWQMDGRKLVELLNAESDKYLYVYKE